LILKPYFDMIPGSDRMERKCQSLTCVFYGC